MRNEFELRGIDRELASIRAWWESVPVTSALIVTAVVGLVGSTSAVAAGVAVYVIGAVVRRVLPWNSNAVERLSELLALPIGTITEYLSWVVIYVLLSHRTFGSHGVVGFVIGLPIVIALWVMVFVMDYIMSRLVLPMRSA